MMRTLSRVLVTALVMLGAACGPAESVGSGSVTAPVDPGGRAVRIETAGCGFAPDRVGSGVAIGDGFVITVAHLVAQAEGVTTSVAGSGMESVAITAVDLELDLALLRLAAHGLPTIEMSSAQDGETGRIVGGGASGTVPFKVKDVVRLSIEEILGTERHSRLGYELEAQTSTGDSGAGAYDHEDSLIGIVFATSEDGASTWITSSAEIEEFLAAHSSEAEPIACDPKTSRLDLP